MASLLSSCPNPLKATMSLIPLREKSHHFGLLAKMNEFVDASCVVIKLEPSNVTREHTLAGYESLT